MAADTGEQGQEFCRILVLTDVSTGTRNPQLESQTYMDAAVKCQKSADMERDSSNPFPSPGLIPVDIEKGGTDISKINQETGRSIKTEIALTKPLRRQNSLQTGGESIPPLMNHILMLLKFDPKEKQAIERAHDAANNRWRRSSMGTIVLIYLTLRVRQVSDGYLHS